MRAPNFDTVKQYVQEPHLAILHEDPAEGVLVVEDEERGIKHLIVDCEDPIVSIEKMIIPAAAQGGHDFRTIPTKFARMP